MVFNNVNVYSPQAIFESFRARTMPFISYPRGGGYWLCKSFLLKQTFDKIKLNDICVYADAGCHINIHGKQRLQEYYDTVNSDESGIISFHLVDLQKEMYTKIRKSSHLLL